jgi:hypothetical protein
MNFLPFIYYVIFSYELNLDKFDTIFGNFFDDDFF